ncbi:MAG TPA: exodeoxyribonuclease VII large subunit [Devosia sp.]|nr:exodeoxyribonuclease VII large subunit [Devosia sp.]
MELPRTNTPEFTVSELALAVKRTVEDEFQYVRVRGEISGFRGVHSSGHAYFTLKDDAASIDAVVWKTTWPRLRFKPEEGLEIIATGRLTTFPRSSKYQIVIEQIEPAGAGALMALLEERRKKLAAEGLFAAERKKKLPYLPRIIGVVTSPTGAVIRDILHRLDDRFPSHVIVWPVRVQGETAAAEVAHAVAGFNALPESGGPVPRPDLLIVARGGGSIEDLWSFNEEIVVRAVAASRIPVISGVGHETDTTLVDYAADHRAPTPSAAAEAAVPVRAELIAYVDDQGQRTRGIVRRQLGHSRDRLRAAAGELPRPLDLLNIARQRLDLAATNLSASLRHLGQNKRLRLATVGARLSAKTLSDELRHARTRLAPCSDRLQPALRRLIAQRGNDLTSLGKLLESYSYKGVLDRGFALVVDDQGHIVRSKSAVRPGQLLAVEVADGQFGAAVSGAPVQRKKPRPPKDDGGQESLF